MSDAETWIDQLEQDVRDLRAALKEAVSLIGGLVDQQAMPDDSYKEGFERIKRILND